MEKKVEQQKSVNEGKDIEKLKDEATPVERLFMPRLLTRQFLHAKYGDCIMRFQRLTRPPNEIVQHLAHMPHVFGFRFEESAFGSGEEEVSRSSLAITRVAPHRFA